MEQLGFAVFFSVVVYCITMIYMQKANIDFQRDEEIKRLNARIKELEY